MHLWLNFCRADVKADSQGKEKKDNSELDLVFCVDCTGSMGSYIAAAQENMRKIVETIVAAEHADVQFALVAYRDHPPQDSSFVTTVYNFTSSCECSLSCLSLKVGLWLAVSRQEDAGEHREAFCCRWR